MATTSRLTVHSLAALSLLLGASACNDLEKLDDTGSSGGALPEQVQRAFDETCALSGCHDSGAAGGLDLSAAAAPAIIGGPSTSPLPMVDPGNVGGSYLAVKMLETPPMGTTRTGARMPIGGDFDNPNNLVILGWIATLDASAGGGTTTDDPTGDSGEPTTTGETIQACGLADVAPDATSPYDIGMDAGQIPPDVGAVLENNCGCHGVEPGDLVGGALHGGMFTFNTIAEIQGDYMGTPSIDRMLARVDNPDNPMPPSYFCNLGGGEVITAADMQLLIDWLNDGAPDAPSWMP